MSAPQSRVWKASGLLLAVYLGLFLTFLPGLHNHDPCFRCEGDAHVPSRLEGHRTDHAVGRGCSSCPRETTHSPGAPQVDEDHGAYHDAGSCAACRFLHRSRLSVAMASVSLDPVGFRENLSCVPEAPDRLQSPYRRLPRGPPSS